MSEYSMICCVVNMGDASKTLSIAKKYGVKGGTISVGKGTVCNRLLDFLCLNEIRKEVVNMVVEEELVSEVINGIGKEMRFHKPNHGIAFSYPVSEFIGSHNTIGSHKTDSEVKNSVFKIIHTVVDKGRGEDVIDAAKKAGARGGTIVNARGSGIHEAQKLFSIEIEPEKEEVFIITKTELKDKIVDAIRTDLEIDKPGKGIMFVLDVNEVYGLHDG